MISKTRRCSLCKKKVDNNEALIGGLRAFCSYDHLKEFQNSQKGKEYVQKAVQKENKEKLKVKKEALKTRGQWLREAQASVNAYVRFRDRNKGCISCGSMPDQKLGGTSDAGHFLSRGAHGNLRFNLLNIHLQCVRCNRYLSGNVSNYREGLIRKIGLERVEALECDNSLRSFDINYLKRIKAIFQKRLRIHQKISK